MELWSWVGEASASRTGVTEVAPVPCGEGRVFLCLYEAR